MGAVKIPGYSGVVSRACDPSSGVANEVARKTRDGCGNDRDRRNVRRNVLNQIAENWPVKAGRNATPSPTR